VKTLWSPTQKRVAEGTCNKHFFGNPSRACRRVGNRRQWDPEILNPCLRSHPSLPMLFKQNKTNAIQSNTMQCNAMQYNTIALSPRTQFQNHNQYFLFPLLTTIVVVLLFLVPTILNRLSILATFSSHLIPTAWMVLVLCVELANFWFLYQLYQVSDKIFYTGVAFFAVYLAISIVYSLVFLFFSLIDSSSPFAKGTLGSLLILCRLNFCVSFALSEEKENQKLFCSQPLPGVSQATLNSLAAFFLCFPMLFLQISSLSLFFPVISIIAIFLNGLLIAFFFTEFLVTLITRRRQGGFFTILEDEGLEERNYFELASPISEPEGVKATFLPSLCFWLSPVFFLSLLPQALTLVGIPFLLRSALRYLDLQKRGENPQDYYRIPIQQEMGWAETRGLFLIPLGSLSLLFFLVLTLPFLTLALLLLAFAEQLRSASSKGEGDPLAELRLSVKLLVACLFYCYFPFLSEVPGISQNQAVDASLSLWARILAILWVFSLEYGIPISDFVTDILFSLNLFYLWDDPFLERRDELYQWMVLSFVATGLGFLLWGVRIIYEASELFQREGGKDLETMFIERSFFGSPPRIFLAIKGLKVVFEDMLQIIVSVFTLSFFGQISGLWGIKLTVSIISTCFTLSRVLTPAIFSKRENPLLRFWTQASFFAFFGTFVVFLVTFSIENEFCALSRSVRGTSLLRTTGQCQELGEFVYLTGFQVEQQSTLRLATLDGSFIVDRNNASLSLSFNQLLSLEGNLVLSNNTGSVSTELEALNVLNSGGSLLVENNTAYGGFAAPLLAVIEGDARLLFRHSVLGPELALPSLQYIKGSLEFEGIQVQKLSLQKLVDVVGVLQISQSEVEEILLPSLAFMDGEIIISNNSKLEILEFPALLDIGPMLWIMANPSLREVRCPFGVYGFSVSIKENPVLERLDFGELYYLRGETEIEGNPSLETILFPRFEHTGFYGLRIERNERLEELDFSQLDCTRDSLVVLKDNSLLSRVFIPSLVCMPLFVNVANPLLEFVLV